MKRLVFAICALAFTAALCVVSQQIEKSSVSQFCEALSEYSSEAEDYKDFEELKQAYKALLEDNNRLIADNKRLRHENTNLKIRLRIEEADRNEQ